MVLFRKMFFLLLIVSIHAIAQETNVAAQLSQEFKLEKGTSTHSFHCFDDEGGIIVGQNFFKGTMIRKVNGYQLMYLDKDLKIKKDFIYEKKNNFVLASYINDNNIFLFEARFTLMGSEVSFVVSRASLDDMKFTETELFNASSKNLLSKLAMSAQYQTGKSPVGVTISEEKDRFLFHFEETSNQETKYYFFMFNADNELVFKQTTKRGIKGRKIEIQDVVFDDKEETAYLLLKIKTKNKDGGGKYYYDITRLTADAAINNKIEVGDKYYPNMKSFLIGDDLGCMGLYSNKKDNKAEGTVLFRLDKSNMKVKSEKFSKLTEQYFKDKYGEEKDKEVKNLYLRNIRVEEDQTIKAIAEEYYTKGEEKVDGPTFSFYKDIAALKLDATGNMIWARNIDKYQGTASDTEHLSFRAFYEGSYTHLVLNNSRSANHTKTGKFKLKGNLTESCELLVLSIGPDGEYTSKRLLDSKQNNWPFFTNTLMYMREPGSIHLMGKKGKKWQLVKVAVD